MENFLIEIIFKNVPLEKIGSLLKDLTSGGKRVQNYDFVFFSAHIEWEIEQTIIKPFLENNSFKLFINLKLLEINKICLLKCGIVAHKFSNKIDVELNFNSIDIQNNSKESATNDLMLFAKDLANKNSINEYFCGVEPAEDIATRLFTQEIQGPFKL